MRIAIHGGMAVGKTTLVKKIQQVRPTYEYSFEAIEPVIKKIRALNLNKNNYNDYLINQEIFIKHEMQRYNQCQGSVVIMDYSAEEVAFQTIHYPKVFHPEWSMFSIENLADKLIPYYVDKILYLDAHPKVLNYRKTQDQTRSRNSFDTYLHGIHVLKKDWFKSLSHVTFLDTTYLSEEEVFQQTMVWLDEVLSKT